MYRNPYARSRPDSSSCSCPQGYGAQIGSHLGSFAESGVRKLAKSWFGIGDYNLRSNSLVKTGSTDTSKVEIVPAGPRETRIIYKEYIGDVFTHPTTAGAFHSKSYDLNPGLMEVFPWLCTIAQQYEQWTPNGIIFEFRSTSSEYVATQALGSVIMATDYDSLDTGYANKQEMLNSAYSNESKPSERIVHGIECDPRDNPNRIFFMRSGSIPSGSTIREYDLGKFTIATQGGSTVNLNLGSLYIHYDITFRKEQIYNGPFLKGALYCYAQLQGTINGTTTLGSSPPDLGGSNFASSLTFTTNKVTFPTYTTGAYWYIVYYLQGSSTAALNAPVAVYVGMTEQASWGTGNGETGTKLIIIRLVKQTAAVATMQVSGGTLPTSAGGHLDIRQVNDY